MYGSAWIKPLTVCRTMHDVKAGSLNKEEHTKHFCSWKATEQYFTLSSRLT